MGIVAKFVGGNRILNLITVVQANLMNHVNNCACYLHQTRETRSGLDKELKLVLFRVRTSYSFNLRLAVRF